MSPKTMPMAPTASLASEPLGVAVRLVVRGLGFRTPGRCDAHVLNTAWTDCEPAFLVPPHRPERRRAALAPGTTAANPAAM